MTIHHRARVLCVLMVASSATLPAQRPPRDSLVFAACLQVYVEEFKKEGNAETMAMLVCQMGDGVCLKEPRGQPCKNSLRRLNEKLERSGQSLPVMAAHAGRTDLINALIEIGVDINKPTKSAPAVGWTPLMFAAAEGHAETVAALVKAGAEVNATNGFGRTALMFASSYGFLAIVTELLDHRADPNTVPKDGTGWTALIAAAHKGHIDVIRALLDHGADVSTKDKEGKTALAWAEAQGHADAAQVLRDATAKERP